MMVQYIDESTTIPHLLRNVLKYFRKPEDVFLQYKEEGKWIPITFQETVNNANAISAYLLSIGVQKGDRVGLIMDNCPEFVFYDQGLQQIGAVNVSIYPTLSAKEVEYIINDAQLKTIVVGNPFLLKKIASISANCPSLVRVIPKFDDYSKNVNGSAIEEKCISFSEMLKEGKKLYPSKKDEVEACFAKITQDDLATLIYTSGTTGTPKGVMLSHGNLISNVKGALTIVTEISEEDEFLSFLPLSHVFERTATYLICCTMGTKMSFAQSLELLAANMMEVRPTLLMAVPRLMEKIHDKAMKSGTEAGGTKAAIFLWALRVGESMRHCREQKKNPGFILKLKHNIADKLVFSKIKEKTGGKIRFIITGGAALPKNVGEFFGNIGIKVMEGFGLTETSPIMAVNPYNTQVFGTVGRILPELTIGIQNPDTGEIITEQTYDSFDPNFECAEGEIILKGPNVMKGYWGKPKETAEVIDKKGWFHTGDVGKFVKGNLAITDRIKNMLVNAYGKNVYPTPVENIYLKSERIEQIFLIGDKREYLTALVVPEPELLKSTFQLKDSFFQEKSVFVEDEQINKWIGEDLKRLSKELANFERVKSFKVKRQAFTIESGELTPTMKPKRKIIEGMYSKDIDALYDAALSEATA